MDEKSNGLVNNIFTILGGALLLYPLLDQAAKSIVPEMQKLTSGEAIKDLKLLPPEPEMQQDKPEQQPEEKENQWKRHDQEEHKKEEC